MRCSSLTGVVGVLVTSVGLVAPSAAQTEVLEREIARLAAMSDGTVGVAAIHLESGRSVFHRGEERFPMASTYKVPIAVQLLTRVDRGEVSLGHMIELDPADLHPGSGTLTSLFDDPGVALSVHNLLELMLLISDNSATDLVLEAAGGPEAVTARMRALGIEGISVDRPTSVLIGDWLGVEVPASGDISPDDFGALVDATSREAREAAGRRFATDPRDTATPAAMARLLQMIWEGQAVGPENTELLIDVLTRVETGEDRLRGFLPRRTTVAHKTGTIGATTNDVGIIYLPDEAGHVVTVVFVKDSEVDVARREVVIAHIARAVHDYFLFQR